MMMLSVNPLTLGRCLKILALEIVIWMQTHVSGILLVVSSQLPYVGHSFLNMLTASPNTP